MADRAHVLTSGQSLSVGHAGEPPISTNSENPNAKRVLTDGTLAPLQVNADGRQRPDLSMGYRLAEQAPAGTVVAMSTHGKGATIIENLSKGGTSGEYEEAIARVQAAHDAAQTAGLTHHVQALHWIQGEANMKTRTPREVYVQLLADLHTDYVTDVGAVTGQSTLPLIATQTACWPQYDLDQPTVGLAQLDAQRQLPDVWLAGPQYQLPYQPDQVHLLAAGYYYLGELHARAGQALLDTGEWSPVMPVGHTVDGNTVTVDFAVPVAPLLLDTTHLGPQPNYGFSLHGTSARIAEVTVSGPAQVSITTDEPVTEVGAELGYGAGGGTRAGNLHDSDPTVSVYDGEPLPNYCVQFRRVLVSPPTVGPWWGFTRLHRYDASSLTAAPLHLQSSSSGLVTLT